MIRIDGHTYSRAHFETSSARFAEMAGLEPGLRCAICLPDIAAWLSAFFAVRAAGATILPIHPSTPHAAARRLAQNAHCEVLLYHGHPAEKFDVEMPETDEGQLLQMSSGTTGAPKCVARGWSEIRTEIETYVRTFREPDAMTPVIACPTTHSYGLICGLLVALEREQTPLIVNASNPKHLLNLLAEMDRPLLYSSPAVLHTLARLMPGDAKLHAVMTSGTLLPERWFSDIRNRSRHLFQQYGCSEAGCIAVNPDVSAADEMGRPLPHLEVTAGAASAAAAEILVRGPQSQIHTRDLGYLKPDGTLVFVARLDDTINVSGLNVYPKEVEDAAMSMPMLTDAVAFRIADRFAGERVGLLFSVDRPVAMPDLRDWCARHLASHQVPMEFVQVDAVPRQANGKISRREIARLYADGALPRATADLVS
jgi:3,4-dihydroxybenzoate---[aryl-carrier protein] ligase